MDEFYIENPDDNEIYFAKPEEFESIRSLFARLENELIDSVLKPIEGDGI